MLKNTRVDCPYCGRQMRQTDETRRSPVERARYLCPARCLTRAITRQEAASWLKKKAAESGNKGYYVQILDEAVDN